MTSVTKFVSVYFYCQCLIRFSSGERLGILSRHQINKANCLLPEIRNFFYHVPSYSSPFRYTQSKRIWENIRLKLCDLRWTPVRHWEQSKLLDPIYKVLSGLEPGKPKEAFFVPRPCQHIQRCSGPSRQIT